MFRNRLIGMGLLACGLACVSPSFAQDKAPTADQQKNNVDDRTLTQQIRKAVMADKTLSTSAHNVKIITKDGMVTLRGQVQSEEEKKAVEAKATEAAGSASKVDNQLTVKAQ